MNDRNQANEATLKEPRRRLDVEDTLWDELQRLVDQIAKISLNGEKTRLGIASELKNNIGQTLLVARIKIGMLSGNQSPDEHKKLLEDLSNILDRAVWEIRVLSQRLCPPLLFEDGLETALKWLARDMEDSHGVQVEFRDDGSEKPLCDVLRLVMYQAVKELLVNVARHAKSGAAWLTIGRDGDMARVTLEDRGVGFDGNNINNPIEGNSGLFAIRRLIRSLGGEMTIRSAPGMGTFVTIIAPLELA